MFLWKTRKRHCHVIAAIFAIVFKTISPTLSNNVVDDLIVVTESGRIRGIRYHLPSLSVPVDAYLGVPFAKPPVGHLRFRHPQPVEKWSSVHNATKLPNSCYQIPDEVFGRDFPGSNVWNPTTRVSEDCLYLNVWVPKTTPRLRKSAVMVWIYGGGFYSGTTTLNVYDGKILAAEHHVIVVSIAYRVGAFGFLSLNVGSAPGNAGLFDQLMALDWIQQNIRHFGGDPNNVTIFGESAGSVSVSLHLLSPLSAPKFQRAILQSGTANMPWATLTMPEARARALELAVERLDCPDTSSLPGGMEIIADCLRALSAQHLADDQYITHGPLQFPFLPVIDGVFLLEPPDETLRRRSFKKCPILIGSVLNEGSSFIIYEIPKYVSLTSLTMNRDQFQDSLTQMFHYYPRFNKTIGTLPMQAIRHQYTNWVDSDDEISNLRALDASLGDSQFICPLNQFAGAYSRAGDNVYSYLFTQRSSANPWPAWMGVLHGDDIMFMLGEVLKPELNFTDDEKHLSRAMMRYWANFAKTGDPNQVPGHRSSNIWPLHTPTAKEYLELNTRLLYEPDRSRSIGRGPRLKECAFWDEYLPDLIKATGSLVAAVGQKAAAFSECRSGGLTSSATSMRTDVITRQSMFMTSSSIPHLLHFIPTLMRIARIQ